MGNRNTIAFMGVGNMGSAILGGLLNSGMFAPDDIILCDPFEEKCAPFVSRGCRYISDCKVASAKADCILLAIKPQQIDELMKEIAPFTKDTLILSIAAGIPISRIAAALPNASVVRVMPNTPLMVGAGVSALCHDDAVSFVSSEDLTLAHSIFAASGIVVEIPEALINPVTALTSSSIAYFARFIGDMYAWALDNGFAPGEKTLSMICHAAIGTAELLTKTDLNPATLERAVTSPGGTTEQAMKVFNERALGEILQEAMNACRDRADELAGK